MAHHRPDTTAHSIASEFRNNSSAFRHPRAYTDEWVEGETEEWLEDRLERECVGNPYSTRESEEGTTRYEFPDGSAIVISDVGWALGIHRDRLPAAIERFGGPDAPDAQSVPLVWISHEDEAYPPDQRSQ